MRKLLLLAAGAFMAISANAQIALTEGWNHSTNTSLPSIMETDGVNSYRSMVYNDGKVYVTWSNGPTSSHIRIFDAYTGEYKGELNLDGVDTGYFGVSGITALGGKIFACNCLINATEGTLKIYKWEDDNSAPTVVLEDNTINTTIGQLGATLASDGNLTDGKLIINNHQTTKIAYYEVIDGAVVPSPTVITLTNEGEQWTGNGSRGCAAVVFNEDGSFWVDAKDQVPTLFDETGSLQGKMKSATLANNNQYGTGLKFVDYKNSKYAIINAYLCENGTSVADGVFTVVDVTEGATSANSYIALEPEKGLGTTRNSNFLASVDCATRNNGETLDIWLFVSKQGLAYYSTDTTVGVEEIEVDANAPVEYYNLQGVKVANPESGLFIKKQGSKTTKVVL